MSYLTQMAGLAVQNFVSAAVGMAVLAAVVRGFARRSTDELGNFWRDLYRSLVYILLPLSIVLAVILISQGVVQTFDGHATATTLEGAQQTIARGPAASQIAIKQLGTNGGGFYNSNSAVPFENPNGLTNFLELLAILLIPAAQVFMFGKMVLARRHAWVVFAAMFVDLRDRRRDRPAGRAARLAGAARLRREHHPGHGQCGGNMSDKEVRFGIANTALWATATTRRLERLGQRRPRRLHRGRRRRPARQHLPRRGDLRRRRLRPLRDVLLHPDRRLRGRADGRPHAGVARQEDRGARDQVRRARRALRPDDGARPDGALDRRRTRGLASIFNPGAHGFTEALYAYDSQGNNNGSAFAGYGATNFSAELGTIALSSAASSRFSRRSRSAARSRRRRPCPPRPGRSAPTAPTFVVLLVGVIALTAGLMIFPALTLGPIVEGLMH